MPISNQPYRPGDKDAWRQAVDPRQLDMTDADEGREFSKRHLVEAESTRQALAAAMIVWPR